MMCGTEADTGLGGSDGIVGVVGPLFPTYLDHTKPA